MRFLFAALLFGLMTACLDEDERAALETYRLMRDQVYELTLRYLQAASRSDTTAMLELLLDSAAVDAELRHLRQGDDLRAAAGGIERQFFELGPGNATLRFTYEQNGHQRQGTADVVFERGAWRMSKVSLLVEY